MTSPKKAAQQQALTEYKPFIPGIDDGALVLYNAAQGEIELARKAMKSVTVRISATSFDVPGDTDDPEDTTPTKVLRGIIIHAQRYRRYDDQPYVKGQVAPPACISLDMKVGKGNPGGNCATCPKAAFAKLGGGKWGKPECGTRMYVYLLIPGQHLPICIKVPPTSYRAMSNYFAQFGPNKKIKAQPWNVVTEIRMGETTTKSGSVQTVLKPSVAQDSGDVLSTRDKTDIAHYRNQFVAWLQYLDAQRGGDDDEAFDAFEMQDAPRAQRVAAAAASTGDDFEEKTYSPAAPENADAY